MVFHSAGIQTPAELIKLKPPADATDFQRKFIELKLDKIWAQIRQGAFDCNFLYYQKGQDT
ncbi:hypothetical protein [Siminovitchia terrae]|uniref:Uncharacterized protein n=1 Tax=Siminovitchia terrae TaxID=1914933 RepID=A0A429XER6_SIMTE|nr:hypothetical protein [Siminovitchia terrae]RST61463.1 hypothetical protein D5F11_000815 [Siminovitchia terrae]